MRSKHANKFWSLVAKPKDESKCWLWSAGKTGSGYGAFVMDGAQVRAHRYAWELLNGPIPKGYFVCHHCDTPACVNPSHLFVGTPADNMRDKVNKNRQAKFPARFGARQNNAKLCDADVLMILSSDRPNKELAATLRVDPSVISKIRHRVRWVHVEEQADGR